jgi:polyhydroxybutyrate depolymerase
MQVGGLQRGWWLAVPDHPAAARLPLLVILHGHGADPAQEAVRTGFLPIIAAGQAIGVYPAGYHHSWNAGRCCGAAHLAGVDDRTFLHRLVTELAARPDVEPGLVDLVGFSNGGKMAFDLVCTGTLHPHAIAVAEAVPTTDCSRAPPTSLIQVAGERDPIVPYRSTDPALAAGGVPLQPVLAEVGAWAARNGCAAAPGVDVEPTRQITTWAACPHPVVLLTYPAGTHVWQPTATNDIWQFLVGSAPAT